MLEARPPRSLRSRRRLWALLWVAVVAAITFVALIACLAEYGLSRNDDGESIEWSQLTGEGDPAEAPGTLSLILRAAVLGLVLLPVMVLSPVAYCAGAAFQRRVFFPVILWALNMGGPALQKWGQWSATRPDLFPEDLCAVLESLHSGVRPHGWGHTRRTVEDAYGKPLGEVFSEFERSPVGSGSIAQVHRAVLRESGSEVAVKVRHPRVTERLWMDVQLMRGLAWAVEACIPAARWLHLRTSVDQFSHTITEQARLDLEAENLGRLGRDFASWRHMRFPEAIFWTPKVIVMTFEHGVTVQRVVDKECMARRRHLIWVGEDAYFTMLLKSRFMHADLHPGNMKVSFDQCNKDTVNLVLIDTGMVARLSQEEAVRFAGLIRSIGLGDGEATARFMLGFCKSGTQQCVGECAEAFTRDVVLLLEDLAHGFHTGTDILEVLKGALKLVRKHRVTISANYATLTVNALCLQSLARNLDPDLNLLDSIEIPLRLSVLAKTRVGFWAFARAYPVLNNLNRLMRWYWYKRNLRRSARESRAVVAGE